MKEKRGNLRQWDICEGGEGGFETAGHLWREGGFEKCKSGRTSFVSTDFKCFCSAREAALLSKCFSRCVY